MTDTTPLDLAHTAMNAAPEDDTARLRFYERLADGEMFMLLAEEAIGDDVRPDVLNVGEDSYVLVFDRVERLTGFTGAPAPYAALSGRVIAGLLAGQGIGLGVNLEVAPSSILIPARAVDWLHATLGQTPQEIEARPLRFDAPKGLPDVVLGALDTKLATATGLAQSAYLVAASYEGGGKGHLLAFVGVTPGAQGALAQAAGEALTFSGIEAGAIDVAFFAADDPRVAAMSKCGLRYDLPQPTEADSFTRPAPGSDPAKPPKLR